MRGVGATCNNGECKLPTVRSPGAKLVGAQQKAPQVLGLRGFC